MRKTVLRTIAAILAAGLILPVSAYGTAAGTETAEVPARLSDLTGAGTVIAVIAAGFDVTHPVFSVDPADPSLHKESIISRLGGEYADCYFSPKLPFVCDYVGLGLPPTPDAAFIGTLTDEIDTDVSGIADDGTVLASLAAGCYRGVGDILQEDGTVHREGDFLGTAPDAQLLFMKAASDLKSDLVGEAVAAAIRDAVSLSADAICVDLSRVEITDEVISALERAAKAGVPVFTGAGNMNEAIQKAMKELPAAVTERGSLSDTASLPAVMAVGAAADPFSGVNFFTLGTAQISYADSSTDYLGKSFAAHFPGETLSAVPVPGYGRAEDYDGLDVSGRIAVVMRGEIAFAEKAAAAAAAEAVGMIVVNNGEGTERMALTDTKIPAVMISAADGARLTETPEAAVTIPDAIFRAADFSARGLTGGSDAAVAFLVLGENLPVAVKGGYDTRSGTQYAAARAAGYAACATEYTQRRGLRGGTSVVSILSSAARPVSNTAGVDASPRTVGRGILTGDCVLPDTVIADRDGAAVSVPEPGEYYTVTVPLTVTNHGDTARTYVLTAAFTSDEVNEAGILTGERIPAPGIYASARGGNDLTKEGETITLFPGETEEMYLRASISYETRRALLANAPYGFYLDGILTLTDADGETVGTHALSFFWGDLSAAPLSDVTVYDTAEPYLAASSLSVYSKAAGYAMPIGSRDPVAAADYDEAYNLVNPKSLKDGALQLKLTALREIESVTVRFLDEAGRLLSETEAGPVSRYLVTGGRASIPLWDFTAADEPEYVFPDGTYYCEIKLTAMDGDAVQYIGFTLTADSKRPTVGDVTFSDDDEGHLYMTVTAEDNESLLTVTAYDLLRQYPTVSEVPVAGETAVSVTYDISLYDGESPLYVEVTDYAGSYVVRRFTLADIARFMEGTP